jgi:hypothetical protein
MIVYHEVGGSAFPSGKGFGMTLRDYFAAQAMQGMLASCMGWTNAEQERMARTSYMMADRMLIERESDE